MKARRLPIIYDYLSPRQSYMLSMTLSDYLPRFGDSDGSYTEPRLPSALEDKFHLPPSHHLVHFPPMLPDSMTLPDGTDPRQSPGAPFTRRMWAGGEVHFNNNPALRMVLGGGRAACMERIIDVVVKRPDSDNPLVFVAIERRAGPCTDGEDETSIRERLGRDDQVSVREVRNVVFMKPPAQGAGATARQRSMRPPYGGREDFSHTMWPNPKLLFRYSSLTFNTHAIHLDPEYCKLVEGLPGLVVHGPLTLTFLCTLLRQRLVDEGASARPGSGTFEGIKSIKYRNTHPLYCGSPVKFCGKRVGGRGWTVWAETAVGNMAMEGEVVTELIEGLHRDMYEDMRARTV
ncbi:Mesaconyl-C(4)-CoA hydratase [Pleurostoma richardsiae]|uniref:Mesaconyl-C(4)-CoA hydratase n=1 Tax=Pleurostoma richardsiae TaxID=41990 RepID=A0AA38RYN6_9PEZI|nr:Mesaconyl-C(4)-CoA hydratase [Pleurostoma richardsiae]